MQIDMADIQRKQSLEKIARFTRVPYKDQGSKATGGAWKHLYKHDWAHLVRDISIIIFGKAVDNDYVSCRMVGSLLRDEFPNRPNWNEMLRSESAHEKVLEIILDGLSRLNP